MKVFKYILCLIVLLRILFPSTKTIVGVILDSNTKAPISNANILLNEHDLGTTSDKHGHFDLSVNNVELTHVQLRVKVIGYKEGIVSVDLSDARNDLGQIFLESKSIELESVHIHSHSHESSQISDKLITNLELSQNIKGNLATTLSNQPNIGINSLGIVTAKPSLRGLSGDRFLLTKDGEETGDLSQ